ncbi:hypothetical protein [Nonomuraea rubra]|uniref:hypothetical protein n=1 Tax=Nonomuraea rubra TaxID=46180 RepID=UPI0031E60425
MTLTPIELFASAIHLRPGGRIHAGPGPVDSGGDGWRLKAFHAKTGDDVRADHWQVKPGRGGDRVLRHRQDPPLPPSGRAGPAGGGDQADGGDGRDRPRAADGTGSSSTSPAPS